MDPLDGQGQTLFVRQTPHSFPSSRRLEQNISISVTKPARHFGLALLREEQQLGDAVGGQPNKLIARQLNVSVRTADIHRGHLM